jgi:pilus assembly protein CpaB
MRRIGFIVLAGLAAALAALVVHSALRRKDAELEQAKLTTTQIVVAAHELSVGTKLQPTDVRVVRWPRESLPAGAITDPAGVVGTIVKIQMVENEPLVASRLYSGDTSGILSLLIPPDMRAMAVAVDEVSDIAGFVLPHARVDVLVALREQGGISESAARAKVVVENVEVLAVAQTTEQKDKPQVERVVTLLVTPEQAEKLALASHEGTLRLALRNLNDDKIVNTAGSTVPTLLASYGGAFTQPERPRVGQVVHVAPPPVFHRPAAPAFKIEVMRDGNSRDALSFGADGKAIHPVSAQSPAPPPQSEAQAEPAPGMAIPAKLAANAAPAPIKPARAAVAAVASADPAMAFEGPDAKTIQVH